MRDIKLKQSINYWNVSYKKNELTLSTVFNSEFINNIDVVKLFIVKTNPDVLEIKISKNVDMFNKSYLELLEHKINGLDIL